MCIVIVRITDQYINMQKPSDCRSTVDANGKTWRIGRDAGAKNETDEAGVEISFYIMQYVQVDI